MSDKLPAVMALKAGARPVGIVPSTFEDCFRMAKLFSSTKMVPEAFQDKPEACCVAIMQGLELGLSPLAALQSIAVINGRPSIWGDGALAVVRASGLVESFSETDDGETATCSIKRKDEAEPIVRKFSMKDAEKAGLAKKTGPWTQYPQRMRQMRARSWALRDGFADVLRGLHIAEEASDIKTVDVTPEKPKMALEAPPDIPDEAEEMLADPAGFLAALDESYGLATDAETLEEARASNEAIIENRLSRADREIAQGHYETHRDRLALNDVTAPK
jgi:hypothetical protein